MHILIIFLSLGFIFFVYKYIKANKLKYKKINKFKNKLLSGESNIEKKFLRDDEKTSLNPNINIKIGPFENEKNINIKSSIHRARLSKFQKSKLNGEMIFLEGEKVFKYLDNKKIYL